jgi:hypothetical protein
MATPTVQNDGSDIGNIAQLAGLLGNNLGSGKTTTTTSSDPGSTQQTDALLQQILGGVDPNTMNGIVQNIFNQAKTQFGPTLMQGNAAGSYNSSTMAQLQNDAIAKATAAASAATLQATQESQKTAAGLAAARLQSSRTQTSQTGKTALGSIISTAAPLLSGYSLIQKATAKTAANPTGDPIQSLKNFLGLNDPKDLGSGAQAQDAFDTAGPTPGAPTTGTDLSGQGFDEFGNSVPSTGTDLSAQLAPDTVSGLQSAGGVGTDLGTGEIAGDSFDAAGANSANLAGNLSDGTSVGFDAFGNATGADLTTSVVGGADADALGTSLGGDALAGGGEALAGEGALAGGAAIAGDAAVAEGGFDIADLAALFFA